MNKMFKILTIGLVGLGYNTLAQALSIDVELKGARNEWVTIELPEERFSLKDISFGVMRKTGLEIEKLERVSAAGHVTEVDKYGNGTLSSRFANPEHGHFIAYVVFPQLMRQNATDLFPPAPRLVREQVDDYIF